MLLRVVKVVVTKKEVSSQFFILVTSKVCLDGHGLWKSHALQLQRRREEGRREKKKEKRKKEEKREAKSIRFKHLPVNIILAQRN